MTEYLKKFGSVENLSIFKSKFKSEAKVPVPNWFVTFKDAESAAAALTFDEHYMFRRHLTVHAGFGARQTDKPDPTARLRVLAAQSEVAMELDDSELIDNNEEATTTKLTDLHFDCLQQISEYLDWNDLLSMADVCTYFNDVVQDIFSHKCETYEMASDNNGRQSEKTEQETRLLATFGTRVKKLVLPHTKMTTFRFKMLLQLTKDFCPNLETLSFFTKRFLTKKIDGELNDIPNLEISCAGEFISAILPKLDGDKLQSLVLTGGTANRHLISSLKMFRNLKTLHLKGIKNMPCHVPRARNTDSVSALTEIIFEDLDMNVDHKVIIKLTANFSALKQISFINTEYVCTQNAYDALADNRRDEYKLFPLIIRNMMSNQQQEDIIQEEDDKKYVVFVAN